MKANRLLVLSLGLIASLLIANGVRRQAANWRLMRAVYPARNLNRSEVAAALAQGADPNMKTVKGVRSLSWAAHVGDIETMRLLLDAGADPNCTGGWLPALQLAAGGGHAKAVDLLLDRGADPNDYPDRHESWSLVLAVSDKHVATVRSLLAHGANPHSRDRDGATVLELARRHGNPALITHLKQAGAKE